MGNKMIRIVRPIDNAPEQEYIEEFFRFIGCFISDRAVESKLQNEWDRHLYPNNQENGVDIIINYFGTDPYLLECRNRGGKRIYCYFDFATRTCRVAKETRKEPPPGGGARSTLRWNILNDLIDAIWEDDEQTAQNVRNIADIYVNANQDELFYLLQAKHSLRVMTMGEILEEPTAQITRIQLVPYIQVMITRLWEVCVELRDCTDVYSVYARVNAAGMIRELVNKLYDSERPKLQSISVNNQKFQTYSVEALAMQLQQLLKTDPRFISAYLLMASLCRTTRSPEYNEEACYQKVLAMTSEYPRGYAFVWYRMGYFYEKKMWDTEKALEYYRRAEQANPFCYQALFKLGYYAAAEGNFAEAEYFLNRMIQAIFHGRSTDPDENGEYRNWLSLSLKDCQYLYKAYVLLAKIALNSNREYSTKTYIGKACNAATRFEEAGLLQHASNQNDLNYRQFSRYHKGSTPVWAMWQVLRPWTEEIVKDPYVQHIVRQCLSRWR